MGSEWCTCVPYYGGFPVTVPRSQLVDLSVTPYYHCISRCVRQAFLCGEGNAHRKDWIENRLEELANIFAISVCSYSAMDNHAHVVVRLEGSALVDQWSDEEVATRWSRLYPQRGKNRKPLPISQAWINEKIQDSDWICRTRKRLANLGWFMKCFKEPLARMANKEEGVTGHFWESRYQSIAILDDEALLATCAYVDLNPVAAGSAELPENSNHTSIKARLESCRGRGQQKKLKQAMAKTARGAVLDPQAASQLEQQIWLCPFASQSAQSDTTARRGMVSGFSLAQYLHLVDCTSRLARAGKAHVGTQVESMLERLGTRAETWTANLQRLFQQERLVGVAFSFSREKLRKAAQHRGCHHLANLCGCKT